MAVVEVCFLNSCCMLYVVVVVSVRRTLGIGEAGGCSVGLNLGLQFGTFLFYFYV